VDNLKLGRQGEIVAGKLLSAAGFKLIENNFACPLGEIDIIADRNQTRYFIEVKTRSSIMFGYPSEAVNRDKQVRLRRLASYYIVVRRYSGAVAFGVVEVIYRPLERRFNASLIEHAF
jgi:putative endonuclease